MEQCSGAGELTARKMFGDYTLYCGGKVFGLVSDNGFYVKPTKAGRTLLRSVELRPPYEGAKEHFYIEEVDDRDYISALVRATCNDLPTPKKRKKQIV